MRITKCSGLVSWFKDYPYPYASADATPLFILAMNDYVRSERRLGICERQEWDNLWRAYQFLRSTYDEQGFARTSVSATDGSKAARCCP